MSYDHETFCQHFSNDKQKRDMSVLVVKKGMMCFIYLEYTTTVRLMKIKNMNIVIGFYFRSSSAFREWYRAVEASFKLRCFLYVALPATYLRSLL